MEVIQDQDLKKLVYVTINLINKNNIKNLNDLKLTRKGNDIWHQIGLEYKNENSYKNVLNIFTRWKRNTKNYREDVLILLNREKENSEYEEKMNLSNEDEILLNQTDPTLKKTIIVEISENEWKSINQFVSNGKRKKLNQSFSNFLSDKLQQNGLKCWLKSKYNWLSQSKCLTKPFAYGIYICVDENCKNKFQVHFDCLGKILNVNHQSGMEKNIKRIFVSYEEKTIHFKKVMKTAFCSGIEREEESKKIMSLGLSNTLTHNILENKFNNTGLNINLKLNKLKLKINIT